MLPDGNKFVVSVNSVVLMVNNVVTGVTTILFDNFFLQQNVKKLLAYIRFTTMLYYNINVILKSL